MTTPDLTVPATTQPCPQAARRTRSIAELTAADRRPVGPFDLLAAEEVLHRIPTMTFWSRVPRCRLADRRWGASLILGWLAQQPGNGWQQRWLFADADRDRRWLDELTAHDPRTHHT